MIEINLLPADSSAEPEHSPNQGVRWVLAWLSLLALAVLVWFVRLEFRAADLRVQRAVQERYARVVVGSEYGRFLRTLARCLPADDVWLLDIDDASGIARIKLRAHNASAIDRYAERLRNDPTVSSLRVVRIWQPSLGGHAGVLEAVFGGKSDLISAAEGEVGDG